jgi:hypothetical protein
MLAIGSALTLQRRLMPGEFGGVLQHLMHFVNDAGPVDENPSESEVGRQKPTWISVSFVLGSIRTPACSRRFRLTRIEFASPGDNLWNREATEGVTLYRALSLFRRPRSPLRR